MTLQSAAHNEVDGHNTAITHDPAWRSPDWPDTVLPRPAWFATCVRCGPLGDGWGYGREQDAASVATKHRRKGRLS